MRQIAAFFNCSVTILEVWYEFVNLLNKIKKNTLSVDQCQGAKRGNKDMRVPQMWHQLFAFTCGIKLFQCNNSSPLSFNFPVHIEA